LDGVGATEFSEEGFAAPGRSKFVQEEFVWWVPGSEGANNERIDFALFVKVEEVLFQGLVLEDLGIGCFFDGIG
jgi:hypothetical protein